MTVLLTAKEARAELGVGRDKFRRWVRLGYVPTVVDPETGWRWYPADRLTEVTNRLGES